MTRQPICFQCGALGTRWFQPLIGTENFCSQACVRSYVAGHRFDGHAQAIHTEDCRHFTPDQETHS